MTETDRFGNNFDDLLKYVRSCEEMGIRWYRYPHARTIKEDWYNFFKSEQRKRVYSYLGKRGKRLRSLPPLPTVEAFEDLGLF
jgi:hypothetical protein